MESLPVQLNIDAMNSSRRKAMRPGLSYLLHPLLYIGAGILLVVLAGVFKYGYYWVAAVPAGIFLAVTYGRKKWLLYRQLQREALVLEEDFIP
jgi:CHASE2 domain-containing sensor protein